MIRRHGTWMAASLILFVLAPSGLTQNAGKDGKKTETPGAKSGPPIENPVFSGDGKRVAYSAQSGAKWRMVVDGQAEPGKGAGENNFRKAAEKGNLDEVRRIIATGVDVNAADRNGRTALYFAAEKDHSDVIRILLEAGAKGVGRAPRLENDLRKAAETGEMRRFQDLLAAGVDANAPDSEGWAALHFASAGGKVNLVKMLVDGSASRKGHSVATISIDARDNDGRSPLMLAVERGYLDIVRILVTNGADIELTDRKRESAMDKAQRGRQGEIIAELRSALQKRTEALDWKRATASATAKAFQEFIAKYPTSQFGVDAKRRAAVRIEITGNTGKPREDQIRTGLREAIRSEGLTVVDDQSEKAYFLSAHITYGQFPYIALQMNKDKIVTGYQIGNKPSYRIEYSLKNPKGLEMLLDPTGQDFSTAGITHGPIPKDSRFHVSMDLEPSEVNLEDKIRGSFNELLVPAILADLFKPK